MLAYTQAGPSRLYLERWAARASPGSPPESKPISETISAPNLSCATSACFTYSHTQYVCLTSAANTLAGAQKTRARVDDSKPSKARTFVFLLHMPTFDHNEDFSQTRALLGSRAPTCTHLLMMTSTPPSRSRRCNSAISATLPPHVSTTLMLESQIAFTNSAGNSGSPWHRGTQHSYTNSRSRPHTWNKTAHTHKHAGKMV